MTTPTPAIGIDIGGTNMRIATVDPDGSVGPVRELPTPVAHGTEADAAGDRLVRALSDAIVELDPAGRMPVGIGFAGAITADGVAVYGPNVSTVNLPVRRAVAEATGNPHVTVVNDANAATWGEFCHGAGRAVQDMLMITLGTGVGGGVITHGRLVEGALGFGGEVGHVMLVADGWECRCGNRGCLEAYASGRSLVRHAADLLADGSDSVLADREITPADVSTAAEQGDRVAIDAIGAAGRWLGFAVASMVNVLDPAMVVVGGGVTDHVAEWLLPVTRSVAPRHLMAHPHRRPPQIVRATLGDTAGMIGAADLARRRAAASAMTAEPSRPEDRSHREASHLEEHHTEHGNGASE